jgi:hypothetical protein
LKQGDPTTLTWSIVPDGTRIVPRRPNESDGPSDLRAFLDQKYGSGNAWLPMFQRVFDRWSELSGVTYLYENMDDGQSITESGFATGERGVRADIRIAGHGFGQSIFIAYNHFPENGDMVLNTSSPFFEGEDPDSIRFRNLVAHEHGHALGFKHVFSGTDPFLMNLAVGDGYDGPQFDDILALQRAYGDAREKNGGNDNLFRATFVGNLVPNSRMIVGGDAVHTRVFPDQTDFVSIDGSSDVDFYSFRVTEPHRASVWLRPAGPRYVHGPDSGEEVPFDAQRQSNLSVELYGPDGRTVLAVARSNPLGAAELIENANLSLPGRYYVRVAGFEDLAQMYRLEIGDLSILEPGDFNGDGLLDIQDLNALTEVVQQASHDTHFDVTSDGLVDQADRVQWVEVLRGTYFGDTNLDGEFTSNDLILVFRDSEYEDDIPGNSTWIDGDWDGDLDFASGDFVLAFKGGGYEQGPRPSANTVPEPTGTVWLLYILVGIRYRAVRAAADWSGLTHWTA